ncbi:MAG: hypothetical protein Q9215_005964 [Flavoplaca cf. flavocitrina]
MRPWESRIRDDSINEILVSLLEDRSATYKLPQLVYAFLNQLLYWVYGTGFLNSRVRQTYQSSKHHLKKRQEQLSLTWANANHYSTPQFHRSGSNDAFLSARDLHERVSSAFTIESVIDHLLLVIHKKHKAQYGRLIESQIDLRAVLLSHLRIPMHLFHHGVPTTHEQIKAIGGDTEAHRPGVYLHRVGTYMYVGQATDLFKRIVREHQSPSYRIREPSLHYWVWQQLPEAEHTWVVLANGPDLSDDSTHGQLLLNLLEMIGALMFQTLPAEALDIYLDPSIKRTVSGSGLNIALPLHQSDGSRGARLAHLGQSEDPVFREYYAQALIRLRATRRKTVLSQAYVNYLDGHDVVLTPTKLSETNRSKRTTIFVRNVSQIIYQHHLDQLGVAWGDSITVRCEVTTYAAHPNAYAQDATPVDPSQRLGIRLISGAGVSIWLQGKGDNKAQRANSLVDELEGVSEAESRTLQRRWFRPPDKRNKFINVVGGERTNS